MKSKISLGGLLTLQGVIFIYTLSTVASKVASGYPMMSLPFLLFFGLQFAMLGIYAVLWQQMIKRIDLSIAYANKAMGIFWSMILAALVFKEEITLKNMLGVAIVFVGIMVVNKDEHD